MCRGQAPDTRRKPQLLTLLSDQNLPPTDTVLVYYAWSIEPEHPCNRLDVNHQKNRACSADGVEFLGFIFRGYGGQVRVSPKKIKKFKDRIREITRRNRGISMQSRLIDYLTQLDLPSLFAIWTKLASNRRTA